MCFVIRSTNYGDLSAIKDRVKGDKHGSRARVQSDFGRSMQANS
jgi:hypothetical protein